VLSLLLSPDFRQSLRHNNFMFGWSWDVTRVYSSNGCKVTQQACLLCWWGGDDAGVSDGCFFKLIQYLIEQNYCHFQFSPKQGNEVGSWCWLLTSCASLVPSGSQERQSPCTKSKALQHACGACCLLYETLPSTLNQIALKLDQNTVITALRVQHSFPLRWMSHKFLLLLCLEFCSCCYYYYKTKTKLHGLNPRANCADIATAACRRSDCQLLRIEGETWSAWRIPTAVFSVF
jgi:hypothetical protein